MDALIRRRVYLQQQLETAVHSETAFSLRYQPQVDAATGHTHGAEALIRWEIADGEWVSPVEFIPLAEESGQILAIGNWLMKNLFEQMAEWNLRGIAFGRISMNISAIQLARDSLAERMLSMMENLAIPAEQVCVEITETTLMTDSERVIDNLQQLKKAGINISIDDFGTGYSSMSYLKAIDASQLKIDRSFIENITSDLSAAAIATSIIDLGHRMGLKVVAEGVETAEQLEYLSQNKCDYMQGFYYSKALPAQQLYELLTDSSSRAVVEQR